MPGTQSASVALTPDILTEALSCRSAEAAQAFAEALFLQDKPPSWMRKAEEDKDTKGMIGLYGYQLSQPVELLGEPVDRIYFIKDWVVALWPREKAESFIQAQQLQRTPMEITQQYYRFLDPQTGPMLGAFEPSGHLTAAMLAKAFGAEIPPSPPSRQVFVGCNYTPVSQADFLDATREAEAMVGKAAQDVRDATDPDQH